MTAESLSSFLLARIAEDEEAARDTLNTSWPENLLDWSEDNPNHVGLSGPVDGPSGYTSIVIDPARVLAECAAKRSIVELRDRANSADRLMDRLVMPTAVAAFDATLRTLAAIYSDHPDYSEDWRP